MEITESIYDEPYEVTIKVIIYAQSATQAETKVDDILLMNDSVDEVLSVTTARQTKEATP